MFEHALFPFKVKFVIQIFRTFAAKYLKNIQTQYLINSLSQDAIENVGIEVLQDV